MALRMRGPNLLLYRWASATHFPLLSLPTSLAFRPPTSSWSGFCANYGRFLLYHGGRDGNETVVAVSLMLVVSGVSICLLTLWLFSEKDDHICSDDPVSIYLYFIKKYN